MFDPTIFDNLKVVAEGAVYDLDLQGEVLITNRVDQIDLARMSRYYAVTFRKAELGEDSVHGELRIFASADDLAAEILEKDVQSIGCQIEVVFLTKITEPALHCDDISLVLAEVWGNRPTVKQILSYQYIPHQAPEWFDTILLTFDRKIDEDQVEDLPEIVDYMVETIDRLHELF